MIQMQFKNHFFHSKTVMAKVDLDTRRVLSKFGAFVRQTARRSIRKRKNPSTPGQPPSSHNGLLKRFIWFGYDPTRQSVIIGPVRLTQRGRGEAPSLLEHGGQATIRRRRRKTKTKTKAKARIRARPFMGPALAKEQSQLPALWRNSVK